MSEQKYNADTVERTLKSMGYVHPSSPKQTPKYKVINVEDEKGKYKTSNNSVTPYKSFTQSTDLTNLSVKESNCPVCFTTPLFICECTEYKDMMCKNNHIWYFDSKGQVIIQDPHEDD